MKRKLQIGIMGAGRMAQSFDDPGSERVLSLAHAVQRCEGMELGGFFDARLKKTKEAEERWSCPATPRNRHEWLGCGWDVICIATPDEQHAQDLSDALKQGPKAILVEKPLAVDRRDELKLLRRAKRMGIPVLVDFPRRWHPGLKKVRQGFSKGRWGAPSRIEMAYSGSLLHSGIHALDFVSEWCAPAQKISLLHRSDSLSVFQIRTRQGVVELLNKQAVQSDGYLFEVTIESAGARVRLTGIPEDLQIETIQPHPHFSGFKALQLKDTWPIDDEPLLLHAMDRLVSMCRSRAKALAHLDFEIERHRFFQQFFHSFDA